ncbi:cell division protein SepF [Salinibacterium sp. GXW1014]|uniref:cell division protein SepF n=1 Tax=Salinibacterium sp. GXW1014 TaxID=3377838 RepID=UPI00383AA41E
MANPLRKTMVYLGLADEEFDYEEQPANAAPAPVQQHAAPAPAPVPAQNSAQRAPVTPLRRAAPARVVGPTEMNEILTVHPRQYKDAQVIAESFREGIPVIINLSQMSEPDARRLVDFASGLSQGLYGKIERVTSKVFLLSPAHVAVSGDQGHSDDAEALYGQQ